MGVENRIHQFKFGLSHVHLHTKFSTGVFVFGVFTVLAFMSTPTHEDITHVPMNLHAMEKM
jgi:hypothetical protein